MQGKASRYRRSSTLTGPSPSTGFCIEVLPVGKNTHLIELGKMAHHVDDQELDEIDLRSSVVFVEDVVDVLVLSSR